MNKKLRFLQLLSTALSLICIYLYILAMAWARAPLFHMEFPEKKIAYLLFLVLAGFFLRLPDIVIEGAKKFTFDWLTFTIFGLPSFILALFSIYNIHKGHFSPFKLPYIQLPYPGFNPSLVSLDWYVVHAICGMWLGATLAVSIQKKQES